MNSFYTLKPLLQIKPEHLQRLTLNSIQERKFTFIV